MKIERKEAYDTGDPSSQLQDKWSKVKVTRPLWMAVQVTSCRGRAGRIVAAAQLVTASVVSI